MNPQAKVSIVMPCHNKIKYIENTMQSLHGQAWDNIELIFVNDGATDGTRDVLEAWRGKFLARGYEVVIIDQENGGIQAAILAGLRRVTGEFVCTVDCDDELDAAYVSTMAGFLQAEPDYAWAGCHYDVVKDTIDDRSFVQMTLPEDPSRMPHLLESFLFLRAIVCTWLYMVRVSYLKECKVIENFRTEPRACQEPCMLIPLAAGGGRMKYFPLVLYHHNHYGRENIMLEQMRKWPDYGKNYVELSRLAIEGLDAPAEEKERLLLLLQLAAVKMSFFFSFDFYEDLPGKRNAAKKAEVLVNRFFRLPTPVCADEILETGYAAFFDEIETRYLHLAVTSDVPRKPLGNGLPALRKEQQGKVSMVMPCYNKIKYTGHMLYSICRQTWDNVELIIVNDGATDGTREVLAEWEPVLKTRGYDVIIIDQENQGISRAALNGLKRVTGDYICSVDCDDELLPDYLEALAGPLEVYPEHMWAACDFEPIVDTIDDRRIFPLPYETPGLSAPQLFLQFLFWREPMVSWRFLARRSYMEQCRVLENFVVEPPLCQEPSFALPYAFYGGKLYHVPRPLYRHNQCGFMSEAEAHRDRLVRMPGYEENYTQVCRQAVERLHCGAAEKQRLCVLQGLAAIKRIHVAKLTVRPYGNETQMAQRAAEMANDALELQNPVRMENILRFGWDVFLDFVEGHLFTEPDKHPLQHVYGPLMRLTRLIVYAVDRSTALYWIPLLQHSPLSPDVLWIEEKLAVYGVPSCPPGFNSLTPGDLVLMLFDPTQQADEEAPWVKNRSGATFLGVDEMAQVWSSTKKEGNMQPKVSVVTPVYNNERFLPDAIESVLAQTFNDWELIIVDDGSTDGSGQIADEYARRDERIHVIHQENMWIYAAMNSGIMAAAGEYVYILNSDDTFEPSTLEEAVKLAETYNADVVFTTTVVSQCDQDRNVLVYDWGNHLACFKEDVIYSGAEEVRKNFISLQRQGVVFDQANLYRASLMKQTPFRNDYYGADFFFNYDMAPLYQTVAVSSKARYNHFHFVNEKSNAALKYYGYECKMFLEMSQKVEALRSLWGLEDPENIAFVFDMQLIYLRYAIEALQKEGCELTTDDRVYRIFVECVSPEILARAAAHNRLIEFESILLKGCAEFIGKERMQIGDTMYFVQDYLTSLLCCSKSIKDQSTIYKGLTNQYNPYRIGQAFYERYAQAKPATSSVKPSYILVGAGKIGQQVLEALGEDKVYCFADNNKAGSVYLGKPVLSPAALVPIQNQHRIVVTLTLKNMIRTGIDLQLANLGLAGFAHAFAVLQMEDKQLI